MQNGLLLSNCIHLSFDSSYSASFDDGVVLEGMGTDTSGGYLMQSLGYNDLFSSPLASPTTKKQMAALGNCVIDIQVIFFLQHAVECSCIVTPYADDCVNLLIGILCLIFELWVSITGSCTRIHLL